MTYQLYHGITMVQVDAGDSIFCVDPAFLFFRDGKEIPTSEAINGLKAADVRENLTFGGYTLTMIWVDGAVSFDNFQTLGSVAYHLWFLGAADNATPPPDILPLYAEWYRGYFEYPYGDYNMEIAAKAALEAAQAHQEPAEAAPAAQVTDDTPTATDAAQAAVDGAMGLLKEDVSDLLDEESPLCITFHTAQRVFMADGSPVTLEDVDKVAELLTASDRLAADTETAGRGKAKAAADVAAAEARANATLALSALFTDEDVDLMPIYNSRPLWSSCGPWMRLYQQLLLLRRSIDGGNLGTLTLTRNPGSDGSCLLYPDGKVFTVGDIADYTVYAFDACDTTVSAALSVGYRIHIDDRYADDDELRYRLVMGMSYALGDYDCCNLMYYLNDFSDDWAPSTCDDVITIAANATPDDLLSLFLVYSFGHWRNDPHSDYEIDDVVRDMAGRLCRASVAPAEAAQDAAGDVLDDTTRQYIAKRIRPRAQLVIDMCDNCIRLRKENNYTAAGSELANLINTAKLMRLDVAGWIPMTEWDDINRRAAAATDGGGDPRYWGYIAAEYIKWAEQQLATATA